MEKLNEDVLADLEGKAQAAATEVGIIPGPLRMVFVGAADPATVAALIAEVREHRRAAEVPPDVERIAYVLGIVIDRAPENGGSRRAQRSLLARLVGMAAEAERLKAALEAEHEAHRKTRAEAATAAAAIEASSKEWAEAVAYGVAVEEARRAQREVDLEVRRCNPDDVSGHLTYWLGNATMAKKMEEAILALANAPTTPAERLTLAGHHLRAAKALCEAVRDDASAGLGDRMVGKGASFQAGEVLRIFWAEEPRDDPREG